MRPFRLTFGPRAAPRLTLDVYAVDSATALAQHLCLALPCERAEVVAL